ncbi:gfo/Idh/MocA family oxidoreductase [Bosea caraganae]|uniref:Gfo/Idh/MocA family oxidoreductase n=1 Tax=Bosea caraganae TaxID=2763117 RepID=A0A370KXK2_9HYPH|nr:Gfo/Idh/MocA family oxidoreductase [Bosea caraganae]RDJ19725.1 gfo/Idh/MocA family oxidoreductase [Bosea caraganae]RDJ21394.1 gfo/Idh/MocA family oxidoreductase [Bosea caraganae]
MSEVKSVAVVGCNIGRSHIAEGYAPRPERWRLAAVCDLNQERLDKVADEFSFESRTTSFDELLVRDDIDVIDLCTPPATHFELVTKALAAGKHVVCEKPLVGSLRDVDLMQEAEAGSGRILMPVFQYRYGDGAQKAKRIIDAGIAGKPYLGTVETHWKRTATYYEVPWRGKWETELGGVLMTHAIHIHDMLTYLMGPVSKLFARAVTRVNAIEVEDCVAASLEMASGALVASSATLGSQNEISRLRLCFENVTFESAGAAYSPGDDPWTILPANDAVAARIDALLADYQPVGRRFLGQMDAFHEALNGRGPVPVTVADARQALELATAFYHSAQTGADIALPIGPEHPKYASWRPNGH